MAQQNVCRFFKYGFYKFEEHCRKMHVKEKCQNSKCEVKNCNLRHPKVCRYFRDYYFCKFGEYCCLKHLQPEHNDTIANLVKENENIKLKLEKVEEKLNLLDKEELETNVLIERLNIIEKKFEHFDLLDQEVHSKDKALEVLEEKISELNHNLEEKETIN